MRKVVALLVLAVTVSLVGVLNMPLGTLPALGKLLDPINGCLANAEPTDKSFTQLSHLQGLQAPVTVWVDSQIVPHIHAANNHDVYYTQGYIHAYFRLWQMDMQTRAAAGRVSEVVGDKALKFDQTQRRKGMVYAAENSLRAINAEPRTQQMLDAYTAGINAYIAGLNYKYYPLEYKLMGFEPEAWTSLKSVLLMKYMADDLTGYTEDIPLTVLRDMLPKEVFDLDYPERISGSTPVIPEGTMFDKPSLQKPTAPNDSVWAHFAKPAVASLPHNDVDGIGSNNWAISGIRTASGAPILCNDPHLGLNLPSLWFQVQLQSPDMDVYGVSLPGAPGVVIGFNRNISWGLTNNYRDVKDFYEINATSNDTYLFNGKQIPFTKRIETIKVKDKPDMMDTVLYTIHGPVMYDAHFDDPAKSKKKLAMCWMAHRATNEMLCLYLLNRANNYETFVNAIQHFECPAQNIVYADKQGNIALWGQGQFVNKWKEQGRFVMEGHDSLTLWKELIPMNENPHVMNPQQGYLCSANQITTDSTYPYWYNGYFYDFRAWSINQKLPLINKATMKDMFALQNNTHSVLAEQILPLLLNHIPATPSDEPYLNELRKWDYNVSTESKAATIFQVWWYMLYEEMWKESFSKVPEQLYPSPERTVQSIINQMGSDARYKKVPDFSFLESSFALVKDSLHKLENAGSIEWYKAKNTTINHLTKLPAFSYQGLKVGGWGNVINAVKKSHGPSWRMVVQMGKEIEAYGVYPGGQSGNPGSKYYASFIDNWTEGKYYRLQFLPNQATQNNTSLPYTWTLQPH